MIEAAPGAGASVVMNVVGEIGITTGVFAGIDPILASGAGAGDVAIVVNIAVENLIIIGPNGDSPFGPVPDLKSIYDVVIAVNVDAYVPVRGVLAINNRASRNLRLQNDGAGSGTAGSEVNSPAAAIVRINPCSDKNRGSRTGQAVRAGNGAKWLSRGSRVGIASLSGYIQSRATGVNQAK